MQKKENNDLSMILAVVGIVLIFAVNSPSMLVSFFIKIVGFLFAVSGVFMMEEEKNE